MRGKKNPPGDIDLKKTLGRAYAPLAKVIGNRDSGLSGADAHEWRLLARGHDHDGSLHTLRTKTVVEERPQFAATLADQRDHVHVGVRALGNFT